MKDPYISYFTDLPKEPIDFSRQQERELDAQVGADDIKQVKRPRAYDTVAMSLCDYNDNPEE